MTNGLALVRARQTVILTTLFFRLAPGINTTPERLDGYQRSTVGEAQAYINGDFDQIGVELGGGSGAAGAPRDGG